WTFNLRDGVKFSSGNPVAADDVVYTVQRVVSLPKNPAAWLMTQLGLTPDNVTQLVTAPNAHTVKFALPQPVAPNAFLSILAFPVLGIVDSKTVKAHVANGDFGHAWLDDHSAGSGPYVLDQWNRSASIIETANKNYSLTRKPAMTRVVFQNVTESSAQFDLLQKGNADLADGLTLQQVDQVKGNSKYHVSTAPDLALTYLGMDVKNVP
ncbi:MAG: ABC transporter substrate-binding protein, partial [Candidatus Dormibacteraeota bacterium]|nr:ABC transporter substrate-binding protein [Candidatus Dormibacteraeota bacterium]